jgi:hypothetical protein
MEFTKGNLIGFNGNKLLGKQGDFFVFGGASSLIMINKYLK